MLLDKGDKECSGLRAMQKLYRGGVPCPEPRKDMKMFATQKEGAETRGQHSQGVEQWRQKEAGSSMARGQGSV